MCRCVVEDVWWEVCVASENRDFFQVCDVTLGRGSSCGTRERRVLVLLLWDRVGFCHVGDIERMGIYFNSA